MLTKKISSQRQAIDKDKFPEADKLLAQIEKKAEELAKAPPRKKDKLLVEMNKLTDALKERQKQLGSPDQVNRQLQQLKEMGQNGPADQFAKDLAKGDFKKAAEQLKKLQEKLAVGQDDRGREKGPQGTARRDGQEASASSPTWKSARSSSTRRARTAD